VVKEGLTCGQIGDVLAEMFWGESEMLTNEEERQNRVGECDEDELRRALMALFIFGFIGATSTGGLNYSKEMEDEIFKYMVSGMALRYSDDAGVVQEEIREALDRADAFIEAWNNNRESENGPQWHLGREFLKSIGSQKVDDLEAIMYVADRAAAYIVTIRGLLKAVEERFDITL